MSGLRGKPAFLIRYIRKLRGSSQPVLVEASDGCLYVVKFVNNPQGQNVLFNECMGTELYSLAGVSVPSWRPLLMSEDFSSQNPACSISTRDGDLSPAPGLCFGSRYLGENGGEIFEILPGSSFLRVRQRSLFWLAWLLDICACHSDNRQCIFLRSTDGTFGAFFIDHGCMFGGPRGDPKEKIIASRYLDPRIYKGFSSNQVRELRRAVGGLNTDLLWRKMDTLPEEWKTESARLCLRMCLDNLSNSKFLDDAIESIVSLHGRQTDVLRFPQSRRHPVLRSGLCQAGGPVG